MLKKESDNPLFDDFITSKQIVTKLNSFDKFKEVKPHDDEIDAMRLSTSYGDITIRSSEFTPKNKIFIVPNSIHDNVIEIIEFSDQYRKAVGIICLVLKWKLFFINIIKTIERFNKYIKEAYL